MTKTIGQVAYEAFFDYMCPGIKLPPLHSYGDQYSNQWEAVGKQVVEHYKRIGESEFPELHKTTTVLADAPRDKVCPECNGEGMKWASIENCPTCQGKGYVQ